MDPWPGQLPIVGGSGSPCGVLALVERRKYVAEAVGRGLVAAWLAGGRERPLVLDAKVASARPVLVARGGIPRPLIGAMDGAFPPRPCQSRRR